MLKAIFAIALGAASLRLRRRAWLSRSIRIAPFDQATGSSGRATRRISFSSVGLAGITRAAHPTCRCGQGSELRSSPQHRRRCRHESDRRRADARRDSQGRRNGQRSCQFRLHCGQHPGQMRSLPFIVAPKDVAQPPRTLKIRSVGLDWMLDTPAGPIKVDTP